MEGQSKYLEGPTDYIQELTIESKNWQQKSHSNELKGGNVPKV